MTAFTSERRNPRKRRLRWVAAPWLVALLAAACRMGLPAEPPGRDAADPRAATPSWQPRPNPYTTSAFEGVRLPGTSEHEHHHEGHGRAHEQESRP